jgi:hypothetical protein
MAQTLEELIAERDAIDAAIAKGAVVEEMTFADHTWRFRSIPQMKEARAHVDGLIRAAEGTTPTYRLAATSKGV